LQSLVSRRSWGKAHQYITWRSRFSRAVVLPFLTDARSARIAETLGLPAAQGEHSLHGLSFTVSIRRACTAHATAHPDEGVSAKLSQRDGAWLRGHTRKDWNYTMRVTAGMRDLRSFYVPRKYLRWHATKNLDSDDHQAGHPELTFELDGHPVAKPKHWRDDDPSSGLRAWLVGQPWPCAR